MTAIFNLYKIDVHIKQPKWKHFLINFSNAITKQAPVYFVITEQRHTATISAAKLLF